MALGDSPAEGFTFLATVMACHLGLARLSAGSQVVRRLLRGGPDLVRDGLILQEALESEEMSHDVFWRASANRATPHRRRQARGA